MYIQFLTSPRMSHITKDSRAEGKVESAWVQGEIVEL
jgi:hypothetical protein